MPSQTLPAPIDDAPFTGFHRRLAFYSAGGPFLDGYVLSIVGVALVQLTPQLHLSVSAQGLVGASALIGMFIGGFLGGWLTDRFGRQTLYTVDLIAIAVCSVAQYWVNTAAAIVVLRLLIGVAVAADYPIATSLLVEFAPRRHRGPLISGLIVMWFVGTAVAYAVGEWLLHVGPDGWRWMLASAALPAAVFVVLRHGTPESPRWLIKRGRREEAEAVLRRVYGENAARILEEDAADPGEGQASLGALFRSGYGARLVFIVVFWTASVVPEFAVYAFGPAILASLGLTGEAANLGSILMTVLFLLGCVVALAIVNRVGRRPLILHSFAWSTVPLILLGLLAHASPSASLVLFAAYAVLIGGPQILQWVYPTELFPTEIRGTAIGLCASLSRVGAAAGTYLVPVLLADFGIRVTMLIAAAVNMIGYFICLWGAPETRAMNLDESAGL